MNGGYAFKGVVSVVILGEWWNLFCLHADIGGEKSSDSVLWQLIGMLKEKHQIFFSFFFFLFLVVDKNVLSTAVD